MATGDRVVTFQGHHSYIVSIAKLCKENGLFTDVTILCDDGKLLAHKIVLAAVSPFLCHVLERDNSCGHSGQTTIVMPDIRKEIVQQLLDFLYTGVMKLSQNATFELQQLVLLLQIDPQNVGVDTMTNGMDPAKVDRLSNSVSQYLGIKIARTADISHHTRLPSPHLSPVTKQSPKSSVKSPPLANGLRTTGHHPHPTNESPRPAPGPTKPSPVSGNPAFKLSSPHTNQHKDSKSIKHSKTEQRSLDPIKISIPSGSIIRSSNDSNASHHNSHHLHPSSISSNDNSNVIKNDKPSTRKRPLSEKIDYNEMMADEDLSLKKGKAGKGRGKSVRGGGKGGGGRGSRDGDVLCAICNQFDPNIPPGYSSYGNKTEWIGCDCNRWFHKFCTRLKEVDDNFSCRLVHKTCLPSPSKAVS